MTLLAVEKVMRYADDSQQRLACPSQLIIDIESPDHECTWYLISHRIVFDDVRPGSIR